MFAYYYSRSVPLPLTLFITPARFMNIIRSLRDIFDALGADHQLGRRTLAASPGSDDGFGNATIAPPVSSHLLNIRYRLMPLLSMEEPLVQRLQAGYINDHNTGEQHIFVRHGWQTIPPEPPSPKRGSSAPEGRASLEGDDVIHDISTILMSCKDDISGLWDLPDTQQLIKRRKLQLSEAASTSVFGPWASPYMSIMLMELYQVPSRLRSNIRSQLATVERGYPICSSENGGTRDHSIRNPGNQERETWIMANRRRRRVHVAGERLLSSRLILWFSQD